MTKISYNNAYFTKKDYLMFGNIQFGDKCLGTYQAGSEIYFAFDSLPFVFCGNYTSYNYTMERSGVDSCNFFIREKENKKDKRTSRFVNLDGLRQWVEKKRNIDKRALESFISKLKELKIVDKDFFILPKCKEKTFNFHLQDYANYLGLNLDRQVQCGSYVVDFVINNSLAIEFDENNHIQYDKKKEQERENFILERYKLVRVNDTDSIGLSLAKISKAMQ